MEEIVIPDLDDDEDDVLPPFARPAFGSSSSLPLDSSSSSDPYLSSHRTNPSADSTYAPGKLGPLPTPTRPSLPKASNSFSFGGPPPPPPPPPAESRQLGKFSNGSTSSLVTAGTSIGSSSGFLANRKGSLASLKNAFKGSGRGDNAAPAPPVPALDSSKFGAGTPGYPALRNPWSRFDSSPASPTALSFQRNAQNRSGKPSSASSPAGPSSQTYRKMSTATNHSSHFSAGGRSNTSQGSSGFRADDQHPVPALPSIPTRQTPSRTGRMGSDAGSSLFGGIGRRRGESFGMGSVEGFGDGEGRTPGEEAVRAVWRDWSSAADAKIARICGRPLNTQPSLPAYLEAGTDPTLDVSFSTLAHSSRRHPRLILDLLHTWARTHSDGISASDVRAHLDRSLGLQMRVEDAAAVLRARKTAAARYILNRALLEIVKVVPKEMLGEEMGMTLESNAFGAYRGDKGDELGGGMRKAVSTMQIELLGELSKTRFITISDRFIRELAKYTSTPTPSKETEARIEHLLRGMRHLRLRVYPEVDLENSAEFVHQLSGFFASAHGQTLKQAYAETFTSLLHPVVETATAEVNHPVWSKAVGVILQRAIVMAQKPRYWGVAFPLVVIALGVSPREVFMQHWAGCAEQITARLRDRSLRIIAMNAYSRLMWIYLNRCHESATSMRKRLDTHLRSLFSTSGGLSPSDLPLEPFICILHYVMTRHPDYGEEFVQEFVRDYPTDTAGVERATALVRAIGYTLRAIEEDRPAQWPISDDFSRFDIDGLETSGGRLSEETIAKPDVEPFLRKAGPAFFDLLVGCDKAIHFVLLSNDAVQLSAPASSNVLDASEHITKKHGDIHVTYSSRHEPTLRLLASVLDCLPRCLPPDCNTAALGNILCRATFSADPAVCIAAGDAMRRITQDPTQCFLLVKAFGQFVFETRHVFRDTFIGSRLLDSQFERVVKLWVDLLHNLVSHQRLAAARATETDLPPETPPAPRQVIDKIEACGLFLLCSTSLPMRKLAGQVLAAARDLEGQERRPSAAFRYSRINPDKAAVTKVIQLYEGSWEESDIARLRSLSWMTTNDRHRLDLAVGSSGPEGRKGLIMRLAESESAKDAQLWQAVLPWYVGRVADVLPGAASEARSIISSAVLRLQGHVASVAGRAVTTGTRSSPVSGGSRTTGDATVLAEQWRNYLSVLTCLLPTASTTPATPPVQRTKDAVILTPDTINSPALFHYLTSLLGWDDPRFKDAAVYALGTISQPMLRPVSEILLGVVRRLADTRPNGSSGTPGKRGLGGQSAMWTSLAHVFRLISPLVVDPAKASSAPHPSTLSSLISFVKLTFALLSDRAVKEDYDLQSLRRSFCIVVENLTNALARLADVDRFLGDEMRGAVFKLCYEWCHVGRRPDVAKARESHTLQAAAEGYRGERDRAAYLDDLQKKTKLLSAAAADAMAGLCQGKLISSEETNPAIQTSDHIVEPLTVLRWIRGMFSSANTAHHDTARKALFALIKYNWTCIRLLDEVLHQSFGEGEQFTLTSSFFGVIADILSAGLVELPIEQLVCLSLSKLGHPIADIRQRAFQITTSLCMAHDVSIATHLPAIGSSAPNVHRQAQKDIADILADVFADHAMAFLGECTTRLSQLEAPRRQATLGILPAWLAVLELDPELPEPGSDAAIAEDQALSNLLYLAIRFSDDHLDDIQASVSAFTGSGRSRNTTALVKLLFEQGGRRKSPDFVLHAQRVMACLGGSEAGEAIFDDICNFVEPAAMAALPEADAAPGPSTSLANLDTLLGAPGARSQTFSTGQLALLFAGELLPHRLQDVELGKRLPVLLHASLLHCDAATTLLRKQSQAIMFQVLRAWICDTSNIPAGDAAAMWATAEHKISALATSYDFWKIEDHGGPDAAFHAPPTMTTLIMRILGILLPLQPRIRQQWGELALMWATSCPIRYNACRSFQIFRVLSPRVSPRMVADTLARLSSTIASASAEIQSFNREVLRTFAAIVQNLPTAELFAYPQIFWCAVSCLVTPFEDEFGEVVELLSHVLDKTNLSDPAVVQHLLAFRPVDWVGPAPHLQALLLVGLRSSKTALATFDLIRRLASAQNDQLIDTRQSRLLHGLAAALPWMLQSNDLDEPNEDLAMMALDLAAIAEQSNNTGCARLLTSFAKARFRTKDDFVRQAASYLREFMATAALEVVTLLLGFVLNDTDWMREKAMQMLALVLSSPDARGALAPHGHELLQPLLRLVSTKHAAQALDILDMPVWANDTPPSDGTGEMFGPLSASGWAVPHAKELSSLARENLTAVFNTCAVETRAASAHFSVVQFADIRGALGNTGGNASQLSLGSASASSPPTSATPDNASMGDLVGALHSLNMFFDDGLEGEVGSPKAAKIVGGPNGHARRGSGSMSERRVRAIMARGRTPSITSPIYESSPYSLSRTHRGKHSLSESFTSDDADGDTDNQDTALQPPNAPFRHQVSMSFSSMGSGTGSEPDRSENLFAFEESQADISFGGSSTAGMSEQSTPVLMKRRVGGSQANG